jgi:hypothetical protein
MDDEDEILYNTVDKKAEDVEMVISILILLDHRYAKCRISLLPNP